MSGDERPTVYSVRVSPQVREDIAAAVVRLAEFSSDKAAAIWRDRLLAEMGALAQNPRRFVQDPQATRRFGQEIRRMLFRASEGGAAYHVFYSVRDETPDGPRVQVVHVRHASRRPITREEARQVLENQ